MHYKLVVTDEMDRLLDERVGYLIKEFKSIIKSKYLIFGIEARDKKNEVSRLSKIESDILNKFKILGCRCNTINGLERLRILHDYLNQDSLEKFRMLLILQIHYQVMQMQMQMSPIHLQELLPVLRMRTEMISQQK